MLITTLASLYGRGAKGFATGAPGSVAKTLVPSEWALTVLRLFPQTLSLPHQQRTHHTIRIELGMLRLPTEHRATRRLNAAAVVSADVQPTVGHATTPPSAVHHSLQHRSNYHRTYYGTCAHLFTSSENPHNVACKNNPRVSHF